MRTRDNPIRLPLTLPTHPPLGVQWSGKRAEKDSIFPFSSPGCTCTVFYCRDFDWSFINENSDTYVISELAPSLIPELKELMKTTFKDQWTALMVSYDSLTHSLTLAVYHNTRVPWAM